MKIVVVPQAFKTGLPVLEITDAIRKGVLDIMPDADVVQIPMADGGDGTLDSLVRFTGGELFECMVTGPLGNPINACWGTIGKSWNHFYQDQGSGHRVAVIESAKASGLGLVPVALRDPSITTSYGTGELIKEVLQKGFRHIIIGLGGSATNDGGMGMAQALGVRFLDSNGSDLPFGGGSLNRLHTVDGSGLDKSIYDAHISIATDVNNPICGENGASIIYGPQKGATLEMARYLDNNLMHLSEIIHRDVGVRVTESQRMGAAGGMAACLVAFMGAKVESGIDLVGNILGLETQLVGASLVLTAEGQIDHSTKYDKLPVGIARLCKTRDIPIIALTGCLGDGYETIYDYNIDEVVPIQDGPMSLATSLERTYELIRTATRRTVRLLKIGSSILPSTAL